MSLLDNLSAKLPFNKQSSIAEYYFALDIGLSEVKVAVWSLKDHSVEILGQSSKIYKDNEDLIEKTRQALDESLGEMQYEPDKILFGVPNEWNRDDNLKEPYLKVLNKISKEFDLHPLAYVTTTHAISHFIQRQDGVAPTVIFLGIGDFIEVSLVRGGKNLENQITKRSDNLFSDIEKALLQFTEVEVLPSKILVYASKADIDLIKFKNELINFPWMEKLPFLHFPKIDVLDEDIAIKSIILAGGNELDSDLDFKSLLSAKPVLFKNKSLGEDQEEISSPKLKKLALGDNFGFVTGDIKEAAIPESSENIDEEVRSSHLPRKIARFPDRLPEPTQTFEQTIGDISVEINHESKVLGKYLKPLTKFLTPLKKFTLPSLDILKNSGGLIIAGVVLLGVIITGYLFLTKAQVNILVEPKVMENTTEVIADPKALVVNEAEKIIPGKLIEVSVTGSDKSSATGSKQIGNPAKGKVIIYNRTDMAVSFSQGTVLTGENNLKFTLDSGVKIASQSATLGAGYTKVIEPGKSDLVGVTASNIGSDSNLPGNSELSLTGYTKAQIVAQADQAFSGGTSKNVTVVTSDDQKKLQAKVLDNLREKAKEELQKKMTDDKKILVESLSISDAKYTFSKQVNDAASEFSLNANIKFRGTAYADTDLRTIVSKLVSTNVPDSYILNLQDSETSADVVKVEKDGKLVFQAKFKAKLLPKLNTDEIKNKIKGKSLEQAAAILKEIDNILGSEIVITPSLPEKIARLPFFSKNITVTVNPK